jgi:hypothetical protein
MGGIMEYNETDHTASKKGAVFQAAINRKLGHPTSTENPDEVIKALKQEMQDTITKRDLRVFEGIYGWAIAPKFGQSGKVEMLTKEDLA